MPGTKARAPGPRAESRGVVRRSRRTLGNSPGSGTVESGARKRSGKSAGSIAITPLRLTTVIGNTSGPGTCGKREHSLFLKGSGNKSGTAAV